MGPRVYDEQEGSDALIRQRSDALQQSALDADTGAKEAQAKAACLEDVAKQAEAALTAAEKQYALQYDVAVAGEDPTNEKLLR